MSKREDFLRELGMLSFTTRLKRITDKMLHDGKKMYQELGLDIEPNWYVIFLILDEFESLSITEIANKIQFAHPSVVSMVDKMTKKGFLESVPDQNDNRKRNIQLSEKARLKLPHYKNIWAAGVRGMNEMIGDTNILELLDEIEDKLNASGFKDRTLTELNDKNN